MNQTATRIILLVDGKSSKDRSLRKGIWCNSVRQTEIEARKVWQLGIWHESGGRGERIVSACLLFTQTRTPACAKCHPHLWCSSCLNSTDIIPHKNVQSFISKVTLNPIKLTTKHDNYRSLKRYLTVFRASTA